MSLLPQGDNVLFPSMEDFQKTLTVADEVHALDQLVIVGARNDIAWMHAAMPARVAKHVAAEIEYPLVAGWFKQVPKLHSLTQAIERVLTV